VVTLDRKGNKGGEKSHPRIELDRRKRLSWDQIGKNWAELVTGIHGCGVKGKKLKGTSMWGRVGLLSLWDPKKIGLQGHKLCAKPFEPFEKRHITRH